MSAWLGRRRASALAISDRADRETERNDGQKQKNDNMQHTEGIKLREEWHMDLKVQGEVLRETHARMTEERNTGGSGGDREKLA